MENAARALTIAGAVLISILVISALIFAYRDLGSVRRQEAENEEEEAILDFNKSFESYDKELYGIELLSLANKIDDYNTKYVKNMNEGYEKITLKVEKDDDIKNESDLITIREKVEDKNDENSIIKQYGSVSNLEALYESLNSSDKRYTTKDEIIKTMGLSNLKTKDIENAYKIYSKYKALKTKRFKCKNIDYYKNGRIKSMTYEKIN